MKINADTIAVLKNFSKINNSILVTEGNVLKTIAPSKTILGKATVSNTFEKRFGIYDLNRFIAMLSTFKEPEIIFDENQLHVVEGKVRSNFFYADENTIIKPPEREVKLPTEDYTVKIPANTLAECERAAGILGATSVAFVGDGKTISVKAFDSKNTTSSSWSEELGETNEVFTAILKAENLKIIPGDYEVVISKNAISRFTGGNVEYFISVEKHSQFN